MDCPLQFGEDLLPQLEGFKYLWILFTSERKMEWEINRWMGVTSRGTTTVCCEEERPEPEGKTLNLSISLHSELWVVTKFQEGLRVKPLLLRIERSQMRLSGSQYNCGET